MTGFSWLTLLGFIRIATKPAIFPQPLDAAEALDIVDGWLEQPYATVLEPTAGHSALLREPLTVAGHSRQPEPTRRPPGGRGDRTEPRPWSSFDADFHRFAGLRFDYIRAEPADPQRETAASRRPLRQSVDLG